MNKNRVKFNEIYIIFHTYIYIYIPNTLGGKHFRPLLNDLLSVIHKWRIKGRDGRAACLQGNPLSDFITHEWTKEGIILVCFTGWNVTQANYTNTTMISTPQALR